jgi:hypothetical protein
MTIDDVLAEVPTIPDTEENGIIYCNDPCYAPTATLRWFVGKRGPLEDERRILAQLYTSPYHPFQPVWVAVPVVMLPTEEQP